ncbi:methylmalonyl-CoA epimerase [Tenuibacillus multivorans]|uniref:Methylmalonyl-CoA mutase, C-terminal domain/methylmalonyl-CoA/ethylmalonyl-CoA epimerase n=1 Tax=Tenuibacillus multivorans TaxID=237069 RepID=A0A1G9Z4F0_9BACI|nr:methylmalonyl-CoA epimerase [Tenuibacillus multivorans]GEL77411.1 methylmalonyl-CoA epimerase [Tenuibacillus multivorans]SDN16164.1 methylmalonyl-CoA mutase, C-terminal domain/methylmalonyl-CoA/ethylmalonyl-CoA epimerase [Tenuibacillus multivorans]
MNKIAHIGIAVNSLDDMIPFYRDALNLTLKGIEEVPSEQVRVAFFNIGESAIELLEPLNDDSPIAKFIAKKGEGIHHVALDVNDIKARLDSLKEQGIRLIHEQPKEGAHESQVAFLHPKAANGVLFELCQQKQEDA